MPVRPDQQPGLSGRSVFATRAFRSFAGLAALIGLIMALAVAGVFWQTNALLAHLTIDAVIGESDAIVRFAQAAGRKSAGDMIDERGRDDRLGLYLMLDADGRKLAGNLNRWPPEVAVDKVGALFHYDRQQGGDGQRHQAFGVPATIEGGVRLLVARDIEAQRSFVARLRNLLLLALGATAATALAGGYLVSRTALRRLGAITRSSENIMAGRLSERIALTGDGDELDRLAVSLNAMLDRIEQLMAGLREVSDNIAHDLKTPLTRLRNRAEAALREPGNGAAHRTGLEQAIEEADELIKTFNAMLLIARLEAGSVDETGETFDLSQVVADAAELYEPLAEERGGRVELITPTFMTVRANRRLIGQAIANLIDNAIKYGEPDTARASGSNITVELRRTPAGEAEIAVADRGIGIPPQDRARALERFVRLEASRTRPGSGIGLSLVAAVARLHGGSIRLEDNAPGLRVVVVLPATRVVDMASISDRGARDDVAYTGNSAPPAPATRAAKS